MSTLSRSEWLRIGGLGLVALAVAGGLAYQRIAMQRLTVSAQSADFQSQYPGSTEKKKSDRSRSKKKDKKTDKAEPTVPQHVPYTIGY